jgi:sucrose-6-phosphate hydrolase SacC (GH32 family)
LKVESLHNPVWQSVDNLRDPSVLKTEVGYQLFYSRFAGNSESWNNPSNWTVACVFTRDFAKFESQRDISPRGCASPGDVVKWHGRWLLPFQTYPSKPTQLVFAESSELNTWTAPKPFLSEALTLPWNELHRVIDPSFVVDGNTLHCFFVGSAFRTNAHGRKVHGNLMGHAITHDPKLARWEILTPDQPLIGFSASAPDGVENTMVFRTGGHWTMIYSEGLEDQHLARATSADLVSWKLEGPITIPRQPWMATKFGAPFVWRETSLWMMILMGTDAHDRTTFGLLSSDDACKWELLPAPTAGSR